MRSTRTAAVRVAGVVMAAGLLLAACGDDDADTATTTTTAESTTSSTATDADTVRFDKEIQTQLKDVGCYTGEIDGEIGPETDAAIVAFQQAEGLEVDGELGPETEAALTAAAKDGRTVCTASSGTTVAPTTTTTPSTAPCTATALAAALPSGAKIENYVCSAGYAGVAGTEPPGSTAFASVMEAEGATWKSLGDEPCGAASAGISPQVLEVGCPTS
jgi:peptidoglycan hydrolase-like protein with peptidoglycan-binding domain